MVRTNHVTAMLTAVVGSSATEVVPATRRHARIMVSAQEMMQCVIHLDFAHKNAMKTQIAKATEPSSASRREWPALVSAPPAVSWMRIVPTTRVHYFRATRPSACASPEIITAPAKMIPNASRAMQAMSQSASTVAGKTSNQTCTEFANRFAKIPHLLRPTLLICNLRILELIILFFGIYEFNPPPEQQQPPQPRHTKTTMKFFTAAQKQKSNTLQ